MPTMHLAGYHVPPSDVLEVARLVDDHELAHRLETAYGTGARILALETVERLTILRALDDPPAKALAELRAVLIPGAGWTAARRAFLYTRGVATSTSRLLPMGVAASSSRTALARSTPRRRTLRAGRSGRVAPAERPEGRPRQR